MVQIIVAMVDKYCLVLISLVSPVRTRRDDRWMDSAQSCPKLLQIFLQWFKKELPLCTHFGSKVTKAIYKTILQVQECIY